MQEIIIHQSKTCNEESIGENQLETAEVHASCHPLLPPARRVLFYLRPVPHGNPGDKGQDDADNGISESRTAGSTDQG